MLCIAFFGCTCERFDGNVTADENGVLLEYAVLDCSKSFTLTLNAGDALRVTSEQSRGSANITIGIPNKEPVYEGHEIKDFEFVLNITESGEYVITVTAHRASGKISFIKEKRAVLSARFINKK